MSTSCGGGHPSHAEESDNARMYDNATWDMYERIVSARRRRLALSHQQVRREEEEEEEAKRKAGTAIVVADSHRTSAATDPAKSDAVVVPAPECDEPQQGRQRPALTSPRKNSSNDEHSTLVKDDEMGRALTSTTSSWADSLLDPEHKQRLRWGGAETATAESPGLPSLRRLDYSSSSESDDDSTTSGNNNNEDDEFIFELDM